VLGADGSVATVSGHPRASPTTIAHRSEERDDARPVSTGEGWVEGSTLLYAEVSCGHERPAGDLQLAWTFFALRRAQ
jgi:hypothetical protein